MCDDKRKTHFQMVVPSCKTELENKEGKVGDVQAKSTRIECTEKTMSALTKQVAMLMSAMDEC